MRFILAVALSFCCLSSYATELAVPSFPPIGAIAQKMGNKPWSGWLKADGSCVGTHQFPKLARLLPKCGRTHVRLPDLRSPQTNANPMLIRAK